MKIVSDFGGDYKDGYNTALHIEELSEDDGNTVFFYGIQCGIDKKLLKQHKDYKRKILLDLWSPCQFFVEPNHFSILDGFDEVYSICPYTTEWTNEQLGKKLMKYCFYPVNPDTITPRASVGSIKKLLNNFSFSREGSSSHTTQPIKVEKTHDVCYVGGLYSPEHYSMMDIISRYKYVFVTQNREKKATHRKLTNAEKINAVAKCKIGICFNKLYPTAKHIASIKNYDGWQNNKAFDHILDSISIAPQIKTRLHELALCKTLILCHRDPWNLVEDYYEPVNEFVYFDKVEDLNSLIPEILKNWDSYQRIIENAYEKVKNFSTSNLAEMIQDGGEFNE
jgi:Glycosyl transferases group 1